MSPKDYLVVGRVSRPHGLKGQVEVAPLTDSPQRFQPGKRFMLEPPAPGLEAVTIEDHRVKKGREVVSFVGLNTRDSIEPLIGKQLMILETEAEKPQGSYWHHEIVGCDVKTVDGRHLGKVTEIIRTGGNDVYIVENGQQYLIPAISDVVKSIDVDESLIVIDPLPGLLEL